MFHIRLVAPVEKDAPQHGPPIQDKSLIIGKSAAEPLTGRQKWHHTVPVKVVNHNVANDIQRKMKHVVAIWFLHGNIKVVK
jgi:hypothetical protein